MLTELQVWKLIYEFGLDIKLKRKPSPYNYDGQYDPEELLINIYPQAKRSKETFDLTLLHELIHARDDLIKRKSSEPDNKYDEKETEKEAIKTYLKKPRLVPIIKELFITDNLLGIKGENLEGILYLKNKINE